MLHLLLETMLIGLVEEKVIAFVKNWYLFINSVVVIPFFFQSFLVFAWGWSHVDQHQGRIPLFLSLARLTPFSSKVVLLLTISSIYLPHWIYSHEVFSKCTQLVGQSLPTPTSVFLNVTWKLLNAVFSFKSPILSNSNFLSRYISFLFCRILTETVWKFRWKVTLWRVNILNKNVSKARSTSRDSTRFVN